MGTHTIGGFYDSRSVVEWNDAEIPSVDAVAKKPQQMFKTSSGSSDALLVAPNGSPYRVYMSVSLLLNVLHARSLMRSTAHGCRELGFAESLNTTHGGEDTVVNKLLEGCVHNAADRNTMTGVYQWVSKIFS